jgi:hypothetical protein
VALAGQPGDFPSSAIAVDGANVYWTTTDAVMMVSTQGGTPVALASGQSTPWALALDAQNVYWTNRGTPDSSNTDGAVMSVPIAAPGQTRTLASQQTDPQAIAVDAQNVYWADGQTLMKMPLVGGSATALASPQARINGIAVAAASVYFTAGTSPSWLMMAPIEPGSPTTITWGPQTLTALRVSSTDVYWVAQAGANSEVYSAPLQGGTSTQVFGARNGAFTSLAVDDEHVYTTLVVGEATDGSVQRVGFTSNGLDAATMMTGQFFPQSSLGIAVDATSVYWIGNSAIQKLTPK